MTPAPRRQAIEAALEAVTEGWAALPETGPNGKGIRRSIMTRAIDAYEAAMWMPISEAPKDDETPVLVWVAADPMRGQRHEDSHYTIAYWTKHNSGGWVWYGLAGNITRFRPLPTSPQDPEAGHD